jgi:hypothetical protein
MEREQHRGEVPAAGIRTPAAAAAAAAAAEVHVFRVGWDQGTGSLSREFSRSRAELRFSS